MSASTLSSLEERVRQIVPRSLRRSTRGFLLVLTLLIVLYVIGEVWRSERWSWPIAWALAFLVFIVTLRALGAEPRTVYRNIAVMIAALALGIVGVAIDFDVLSVPALAAVAVYAFAAPVIILLHVMRSRQVTSDVITGAVCVYVLLGIDFAILYDLISRIDEAAFVSFTESRSLYYFSFMTLTTVGYGDITPASELTRALTVVQALAGQIFLVVMVARLVGMQIAERFAGRSSQEDAASDEVGT